MKNEQEPSRDHGDVDWEGLAKQKVQEFERILGAHGLRDKHLKEIAKLWLSLVQSHSVAATEVKRFVGILKTNRYQSSPWDHLAGLGYEWARSSGFDVPSFEEFYAAPTIFSVMRDRSASFTFSDKARYFVTHFEEQASSDSGQEIWDLALTISREWLRISEMRTVPQAEASALINMVDKCQDWPFEWGLIEADIFEWSIANGLTHLWSQRTQEKFKYLSNQNGV